MPVGKEPGLGGPRPEDAKATEQTQKEVARNTRVEAFTAELDLSKPLPDWMSTNVDRAAGFARPNFDSDVRGGQFGDSGGYTETVMGFQDAAWRKVKDSLETMPENQLRTALLAWEHPSKKHSGKTHVAMLETATNAVKAELKRRKDAVVETRISAYTDKLDLSQPLPDWMSANIDRAAGFARPDFGNGGGYTETVMGFQDAAWRKVKDSLETMPENQLRTALLAWEHPSKKHSGKTHVAMLETATNAVKAELKRRKDTAAQTSEGKA